MEHHRVIPRKDIQSVPGRVGHSRGNVTLLPCGNVAGNKLPPFIIVKCKTPRLLRPYGIHEGPESTERRFQKKAWMDDALWFDWFINVFLKYCGPKRPPSYYCLTHTILATRNTRLVRRGTEKWYQAYNVATAHHPLHMSVRSARKDCVNVDAQTCTKKVIWTQ